MKKTKKLVLTVLTILVAFSLIAAGTYSWKYVHVTAGRSATAYLGRAGITIAKVYQSGDLRLARKNLSSVPGRSPLFTQRLFDVRFYDMSGNRITPIIGSVHVFFKLVGKEEANWNKGHLTIYYFEPWGNYWKECPTFEVRGSVGKPVLACRIKNFGLYGLGLK